MVAEINNKVPLHLFIRNKRRELGITQQQMATKINRDVSNWVRRENRELTMTVSDLFAFGEVAGITVEDLIKEWRELNNETQRS